MKKNLKRISVFILALIIACISIIPVLADTIYYDNGLLYTYLNNDEVTICGAAEGVTEVKIPFYINYRYVVDIRNRAFLDNTEITSVDFSNIAFLRRIGSYAFANCSNLTGEVVIPNTVATIDTAAFQGCTSLDSVIFNATNGSVPNQCFSGCAELSNVTLNDTVTEIGYYAFASCPSLTYIEIPASVTSIAQSSFQNDTDITLGVYRNSYALEYAESNNINYVILDPEPTEPITPTEESTIAPTEPVTEAPTEPVTETPEPTAAPTELPTESIKLLLGDANGDGNVDIIDATIIQRVLANIKVEKYDALAADVDGNGEVDNIDVTFIMRYCSQIPTAYSIGEWIDR